MRNPNFYGENPWKIERCSKNIIPKGKNENIQNSQRLDSDKLLSRKMNLRSAS